MDLFNALPLTPKEHTTYVLKHNGSLEKWVGFLLHVRQGSHVDLAYAVMRLSTFMSNPCGLAYDALHMCMRYLYHHPHFPIMYPNKQFKDTTLRTHFEAGKAEFKRTPSSINKMEYIDYHDSDLARDLHYRLSVNSSIHEMNGVIIDWECKKQSAVSEHSNGSEVRALFQGVKRTLYKVTFNYNRLRTRTSNTYVRR